MSDTGGLCGQLCPGGFHWDDAQQMCVPDQPGPQPGGLTPQKVLIATGLAAGAILALTYALGQEEEDYGESPPGEYEAYPFRRV